MTDNQRHACYVWQDDHLKDLALETLTLPEARSLLREACRLRGVAAPSLEVSASMTSTHGIYFGRAHLIRLSSRTGLTVGTTLHEAAHAVIRTWRKAWPAGDPASGDPRNYFHDDPGHGPYWLRVYLDLLRDLGYGDRSATTPRHVRVASASRCQAPDPLAAYYGRPVRPAHPELLLPPPAPIAWCDPCARWHPAGDHGEVAP